MNSVATTVTPVGEVNNLSTGHEVNNLSIGHEVNHLSIGHGNISSIALASLRDHNEKVELKWKNINYQTLIKDPQASAFMKPIYKVKNMLVDVSGIINVKK